MNSLYPLALRQVTSLQNELSELERNLTTSSALPSNAASLHGQIAASFSSLQRTLDDYDSMSKSEVIESKRSKAIVRIEKFREDYIGLKKQFEQIKALERRLKEESQRNELFQGATTAYRASVAPSIPATAESPYQANLHRINASSNSRASYRTHSALDEHQFLSQTNNTLDAYIAQGQAILGNLGDQRDMLKGTQKRLRSAANVLGLSRETIQFIERRSKGDFIIFGLGVFVTLLAFYYILRFLG